MVFKIDNLKDYEAVQSGEIVIVQLPLHVNRYMVSDRQINGDQVVVSKDEIIYRYTPPKRTWVKTVLADGRELTPQEVNQIQNEYYDDDFEGNVYPSLDEEFEHRKVLETISKGEEIYDEEDAIKEPIDYVIVGVLNDTGSRFIESAVSYGKGRFYTSDNSFFKLNVCGVIGDTLRTFAEEARLSFHNGNHSGYKFAKINGQYVIGSGGRWEKDSETGSFRYFPTLNAAQTYENDLREELRTFLLAKFNMNVVGKVVAAEIFTDLNHIRNAMDILDVKKGSEQHKRSTIQTLDKLLKKLANVK